LFTPKIRPVAAALLGLSLCSTPLYADFDIEPNKATEGKSAELSIKIEPNKKIRSIDLSPGGPAHIHSLNLDGTSQGPYQLKHHGDEVWVTHQDQLDRPVARFPSGNHDEFKGLRYTPAGQQGLFIEQGQQRLGHYRTTGPALDISIAQGKAYLANGENGVTLLDLGQGPVPFWLSSHQKLGRVELISTDANHVLAANDDGVVYFINVSNPVEPTVVSGYRSDVAIHDIALKDNTAFLLTDNNVEVIDFSHLAPQISNEGLDFGQGVNFGGERRVYIENDLAYVADWFSGMHIYDISRPTIPVLLSSFHTPGSPKGMVVRDGVAFVPDDDHGLQIIDVTNPQAPTLISHLQTAGLGYTPKLQDDLLYLSSHRGGFQIIDVSDVTKPRQISEYNTDGQAWSLEIKGDILYVADNDPGLMIFDVSNPEQAKPIGQFSPGGAAEEVLIHDNIAFVAFFEEGLYILDIGDPTNPKLISHSQIPGNTRGLELVGDTLYVASWLAGVHSLDVSDLSQPRILGQHDTRGATWGIKTHGDYLYAMDWWGGITVVDISEPTQPVEAGGYHNRGRVNDIATKDTYAYVAQGSNGIQVFDIKNPLHPTWTTGVEFPGQAQAISLQGNTAYVAAEDGGIAIIDISSPFNIKWLDSIPNQGNVIHSLAVGNYLFSADDRQQLRIYDIRQSHHPVLLKRLAADVRAITRIPNSEGVYVATSTGIYAYAIEGEEESSILPNKLTRLLMLEGVQAIVTTGQQIIVAQGNQLKSYRITDKGLSATAQLTLTGEVRDFSLMGKKVFANLNSQILALKLSESDIKIKARYPLLANTSKMMAHKGILYLSGAKTVTAVDPIAQLQFKTDKQGATLFVPSNLALGHYNVTLNYDDGGQDVRDNVLMVQEMKFSKPKMTLEDFNKLMKQQQNSEIFTSPGDQ